MIQRQLSEKTARVRFQERLKPEVFREKRFREREVGKSPKLGKFSKTKEEKASRLVGGRKVMDTQHKQSLSPLSFAWSRQ